MFPKLITFCAACVVFCGCGGATSTGTRTEAARDRAATIALQAGPSAAGEIVVRGDVAPAEHGPFTLHGAYVARFEQTAPEDPKLDFSGETAFVARLEQPAAQGAGRRIALFSKAARSGRADVVVPRGTWRLVVDFGDYPYVMRLTPSPR